MLSAPDRINSSPATAPQSCAIIKENNFPLPDCPVIMFSPGSRRMVCSFMMAKSWTKISYRCVLRSRACVGRKRRPTDVSPRDCVLDEVTQWLLENFLETKDEDTAFSTYFLRMQRPFRPSGQAMCKRDSLDVIFTAKAHAFHAPFQLKKKDISLIFPS